MACCCGGSGSCCTVAGGFNICNTTERADCSGTYAGNNTKCNLCSTGAFFRTCTVTVTTDFGSIVASCTSPTPAQLEYECGKVRNSAGSVVGTTCMRASAALLSFICSNSSTLGSRACDASQDGAATTRYYWNLSVVVERRDGAAGCGGGEVELIRTYYLFAVDDVAQTVQVQQSWSGQQANVLVGAICGVPNSGYNAPDGWIDLRSRRCWPCGTSRINSTNFTCGSAYFIVPNAVYGDERTVDCCTESLTHTVSVACAP